MSMASFASLTSLVFLVSSLLLLLASHLSVIRAQTTPPLVKGLSWNFHTTDCPKLEKVIRDKLQKALKKDIGLAAGLLRIHFHDCFVQGCDGSVLLDGSASGPSEQNAPPNLSLRPEAFKIINELRESVDKACGQIVSCADITALAARDAVFLSGGPDYQVPLGRRDGLNFATRQETLNNLPPFFFTARQLIDFVANKGLDATNLVAISGGHTIGIGHCTSFTERLYPNQDSTMDQTFAKNLKRVCPAVNSTGTTDLFDNKYYVDLMNRDNIIKMSIHNIIKMSIHSKSKIINSLCISYKCCTDCWIKICMPLIGVDGCHLKGKYCDIFLSIVSLDGIIALSILVITYVGKMTLVIGNFFFDSWSLC